MLAQPFVHLFLCRLAPKLFAQALAHILTLAAACFFKPWVCVLRLRCSFPGRVRPSCAQEASHRPGRTEDPFVSTVNIYHHALIL
jgi:hypothetical protein